MKRKLTILRGKERKKKQICNVKQVYNDLYTLRINHKGKRTVGKANKGINAEKNNNRFKKLKIKHRKIGKKEKKRETSQSFKSPM